MVKYDPNAARIQARAAIEQQRKQREQNDAERATRTAEAEALAEKQFVNNELTFADKVLARFKSNLTQHFSRGYEKSYLTSREAHKIDVVAYLSAPPREDEVFGKVYERYGELYELISEENVEAILTSERHPGLATIIRMLKRQGFQPRIAHHEHWGRETGYDARSFIDWRGVVVEVDIPRDGEKRQALARQAERALINEARSLLKGIPDRAVQQLAKGKESLTIADFGNDPGFHFRSNYHFYDRSLYSTSYISPGEPMACRALEQDPYYGVLLRGLRRMGLQPQIKNTGHIVVEI